MIEYYKIVNENSIGKICTIDNISFFTYGGIFPYKQISKKEFEQLKNNCSIENDVIQTNLSSYIDLYSLWDYLYNIIYINNIKVLKKYFYMNYSWWDIQQIKENIVLDLTKHQPWSSDHGNYFLKNYNPIQIIENIYDKGMYIPIPLEERKRGMPSQGHHRIFAFMESNIKNEKKFLFLRLSNSNKKINNKIPFYLLIGDHDKPPYLFMQKIDRPNIATLLLLNYQEKLGCYMKDISTFFKPNKYLNDEQQFLLL